MKKLLIPITMLVCLSACNKMPWAKVQPKQDQQHAQAKDDPKAKPAATAHKNVNQPVEDAMSKIPPDKRVLFQSALECEIKHHDKSKPAIVITAEYVRDLTSRLIANPSIAKC